MRGLRVVCTTGNPHSALPIGKGFYSTPPCDWWGKKYNQSDYRVEIERSADWPVKFSHACALTKYSFNSSKLSHCF